MSTTTAALLLAATWAGALLGRGHLPSAAWAVAAAALALVCPVAILRARRAARPAARGLVLLLAALTTAASATGASVRHQAVHAGPLRLLAETPTVVRVDLVIVGEVREPPQGGRWVPARLQRLARPGGTATATRERVLLRPPAGVQPQFGATYAVTGLASVLDGPAAPHLATLGITVDLGAAQMRVRAPPPGWQAATTWLRHRVAAAAHARLGAAQASLLTGLVTGDVRGQPPEIGDAVTASGLSHLVAVSGSNVAVVVAGVMAAALLTGLGRRAGWWLCLPVIWWFVVLVRLEPSVVRAAVTASLVLVAMLVGRLRSTTALLCLTGTLALLADPLLAPRPGFVLSLGATAGVLLLMPTIDGWLQRHTSLPGPVRVVLAATCGAQLAVAPVLWGIGGTLHPASVPANLVAVPAAALASVLGGVVTVLSTVAPGVAGAVAVLARPPLAIVLWSATTFASPAGQRAVEVGLAVLSVLAVARGWSRLPRPVRRSGPALVPIVLVGMAVLRLTAGDGRPDVPVLVMLDVGQGDALLLGDPAAGWVLVDGGPDPDRLRELLDARGVDRLAAAVASHPHADHVDGLVGVLGTVEVGVLVLGPPDPDEDELLAAAAGSGVAVARVAAGEGWDHGSLRLAVLSPPPGGLGGDANENSLVLRVDAAGGRSALLTGDAEALAQGLLAGDPRLDVDVVKVPHHGGDTNAPGFLDATTPAQALISVGADNTFGHPHPDVLADLAGVAVHRTDLEGTVEVPLAPTPGR